MKHGTLWQLLVNHRLRVASGVDLHESLRGLLKALEYAFDSDSTFTSLKNTTTVAWDSSKLHDWCKVGPIVICLDRASHWVKVLERDGFCREITAFGVPPRDERSMRADAQRGAAAYLRGLASLCEKEAPPLQASAVTERQVDHPPHYTFGSIEVIDVIEDWGLTFHGGNVLKYLARAPYKGRTREDLQKARWYASRGNAMNRPTRTPSVKPPRFSLREVARDWKMNGAPVGALAGLRNQSWEAVVAALDSMLVNLDVQE